MLAASDAGRGMLRLSDRKKPAPLAGLALGQLIAWGSLYYGIAFLAPAISEDTGWSPAGIFSAYSAGLLAAALLAAPVGRLLAHHGGRAVMAAGSMLAAGAFVMLAASPNLWFFHVAWLVAGASMAMILYEAAFSTLREYGVDRFRRGVGVVTVVGGFASTVFWPLTEGLVAGFGWRTTALAFAALHLGVGLPLHLALPAPGSREGQRPLPAEPAHQPADRRIALPLASAFACAAMATSAVSAHVVVLLDGRGLSGSQTAFVAALIGPMQVAARLAEWRLGHRISVAATGRLAFGGLLLGLSLLAWNGAGTWSVFAFAAAYGAANGVLTAVRGSAPAEWLPGAGYAANLGMISTPALAARALAPLAAAAGLAAWGTEVIALLLAFSALTGLLAFSAAAARVRILAK